MTTSGKSGTLRGTSAAARRPSGLLLAAMGAANTIHNGLYRLSHGRFGGKVQGTTVLLLTTTGRKTGRRRTVPVSYLDQGDHLLIVGSVGGMPWNPGWYFNVRANQRVTVEVRGERREMVAKVAEGEERTRLWARMVGAYPLFDNYQRKARRQIPVVSLRSVEG